MQTSRLQEMLSVAGVEGEMFTTEQATAYRSLRRNIMAEAYTAALTDLLNYRSHFSSSAHGFMLVHDHLAARIDQDE